MNGASIAPNTGLEKLIEHNQLLYRDLLDPVALLRDPRRSETAIAAYFPYGEAGRPEIRPRGISWFWWVVAVLLSLAFVYPFLRQFILR